uniref:tRNA (N(6)-L-threonylcarbamoyladenosine(37)-C(2))-methylthiotransferase n=1 Tax=Rodentolepis nana TaxID=102285 RepID=A0A158QH48_RODNA
LLSRCSMDIEDISLVPPKSVVNDNVHPRFIKKGLNADTIEAVGDNIPGTQKIFIQVWGCAHNTSDAEYMAGLLSAYGYQVTLGGSCCDSESAFDNENKSGDEVAKAEADLWLLNSCTVKGPAEDHFRNAVIAAKESGKAVVVAGCVPQGSPNTSYLKNISVVGVQQIDRVVEVVEQTLMGNVVRFMEKRVADTNDHRRLGGAPLSLPKIRRNPLIEILAISTGCLNACTYCKTKHARGVLASYPVDELVQRAVEAFNEPRVIQLHANATFNTLDGVKELWLTSEDLGAYGRDLSRLQYPLATSPPSLAAQWPHHLTLADLLYALVPVIPRGAMMRLGMTNPPYILDQLEYVSAVLRDPRVYAFIHIPVQSGSNNVLDAMRREYTVEEFQHVVDFLSNEVHSVQGDKMTVATDIICGFPNETEADFQKTLQLVEKNRFPVLFINQFFARPGTPAATMERSATTAAVKLRTKALHNLFRSYQPYAGREGRQYRVLITETSTDGKHWVGHTKAYEQILILKEPGLHGRIVEVMVTECDKFFMRGVVTDRGPFDSLCEETVNTHEYLQIPKQQNGEVPASKTAPSWCSTLMGKSSLLSSLLVPSAVILLLGTFNFTLEVAGYCSPNNTDRVSCESSVLPRCYSALDDRCDGFWDCPTTGHDEVGCFCPTGTGFSCADFATTGMCYSLSEKCDGVSHCADRSDESNCLEIQCSLNSSRFLCLPLNASTTNSHLQTGECISLSRICDDHEDCSNGADEASELCHDSAVPSSNVSSPSPPLSMPPIQIQTPMELRKVRIAQHFASLVTKVAVEDAVVAATSRVNSRLRTLLTYVLSALLGPLLIVLTVGLMCRSSATSATSGRQSVEEARRARQQARYNSPIQRLIREEIRRRPPPPTYEEALNNSLFEEPILEGAIVPPLSTPPTIQGVLSQERIAAVREMSMKPIPTRVDVAVSCDLLRHGVPISPSPSSLVNASSNVAAIETASRREASTTNREDQINDAGGTSNGDSNAQNNATGLLHRWFLSALGSLRRNGSGGGGVNGLNGNIHSSGSGGTHLRHGSSYEQQEVSETTVVSSMHEEEEEDGESDPEEEDGGRDEEGDYQSMSSRRNSLDSHSDEQGDEADNERRLHPVASHSRL